MLNRIIIKYVLIAGAIFIATVSCDDLLQVEPQQSVSLEVATGSAEGIKSIYNRGYRAQMFEAYWGQRMVIAGDALADNAIGHPLTSGRYTGEPVNSFGSGVGGWNRYLGINDINTVIKYAPDVAGLTAGERSRIEGEMLFLRALAYHDLVKVYGYEPNKIVGGWDRGVILRLEPTERIEDADNKARASVQQVYEQIEIDLLRSITLLTQQNGNAPHYASRAAAHALLARVYLYWERWDDAIEQASLSIQNSGVSVADASVVPNMFNLEPNPESLFELKFTSSESLGINTALSSILTPLSHYDLIPSDEFLATLEPGDVRNDLYPLDRDNYPGLVDTRSIFYRYVSKYEASVAVNTDNVPVIRISEVYLTRAEAYAERDNAGDDLLALADLNEIRTNRGLDELLAPPADLVEEILLERRRELAFEGHRWQDLKRKGWDIIKPAEAGTPPLIYGENIQFLSRIPTGEVSFNENLEQNPGY